MAEEVDGESFSGDDWYGEELADRVYRGCTFFDVDLTESVSQGAVFEECRFGNVRFNASRHTDSGFVRCTFERCSLFDVEFTGCKLMGSAFTDCELRPLTVHYGDWSFADLNGAKLRGVKLRGVRLREADLSGADLTEAVLADCDLSGAVLRGVVLARCDLRGSDLSALDPALATLTGAVITPDQAVTIATLLGLSIKDSPK
jgi:uncharacterized protein YjbI with pentapeptide repeats